MQNLIFIGTLHARFTPHGELRAVLEQYQPEMLLVEISQADLESDTTQKYPDEMVFAAAWAKENGISVYGFDSDIEVHVEGLTETDNQAVIDEQRAIPLTYNRKDANKSAVNEALKTPLAVAQIDPLKWDQREHEMEKNINQLLDSTKRIVIITGVGHLDYFEKQFPQAVFPFRSPTQ